MEAIRRITEEVVKEEGEEGHEMGNIKYRFFF
jgi:hypothetical protein